MPAQFGVPNRQTLLHLPANPLRISRGLRMSQAISAETESADAVEVPVEALKDAGPQTGLDCLARVATHHGIDLPAERLRHAYAVDGTPTSGDLLLRMAKEAGLRAQATRLDWSALSRMGDAYPVLLKLGNGNWVVILRTAERPDGETAVVIHDPLAERQGEPLIVPGIPLSSKISRILNPSLARGRTSSSRQLRQIGWVPRASQSDICLRSRVRTGF